MNLKKKLFYFVSSLVYIYLHFLRLSEDHLHYLDKLKKMLLKLKRKKYFS